MTRSSLRSRASAAVLGALLLGACAITVTRRGTGADATRIVASDTALAVLADSLVPEAIAYHHGGLLLGSVAQQRVYRVAFAGHTSGRAVPWSPRLGGPVLGLEVDSARGVLWAAVMRPAGRGSGALIALRLADGGVARMLPLRTGKHLPNDLALAPDGTIYLTDSDAGIVWSLAPGAEELTIAVPAVDGWTYPNGVALTADGAMIYVAYSEGIAVGRTGEPRLRALRAPAGVALGDIDGLYVAGGALIGIQQTGETSQVVRIALSDEGRAARDASVLERRHPAYDAPTTGLLLGDAFYFLANSQLSRWQSGRPIEPTTIVLRLPMPH
jgi:sugar lactone lactonase YvrE